MNLSLLFSLAALAQDGQVVLPASEVLETLEQAVPQPEAERPPVSWLVPASSLVLKPGPTLSKVALEVELVPIEPGWVSLPVLDGRVRLTDQSLPLHQGPDGSWWFTGYVSSPLTLKVQGTLAVSGESGQVASLKMAQGVRQEVRVQGNSGEFPLVGKIDGQSQGVIAPRSSVSVAWSPERAERANNAKVIQAEVSTAAWLDEGALNLRSKVRWEVRRGSYATLRLRIPAGASEVDVTGIGLARWERQGNELLIEPLEALDGAMEVQVDWRQTFTKGEAQVSHPQPVDAANISYNLTLAGDSETLLSPSAQGMRSVAVEELPPKARAIGDAPANAAWTGPGTLSLKALKLNSLDGPDLVVDLARCTAAQSFEGRTLMTCSLDVRNASKQFLGISLPEGFTLWSARVNGDGVSPVRMDDGQMNVPLERSVETLAGLTAIAVELTFLGDEQAWDSKGERAHELPAFDAPVARLEWELRLPPGYKATAEGGSARVAGETTTELVYASASEAQTAVQAREVWNLALDAYQDNDFETAQSYVDQTLALDADNYNAVSLQTNLDVLSGDSGAVSGADEAMSRRVKDMAKAKVADDEVLQEQKLAEAEQLLNEGRYEEAIESYEEVEKMSQELARYEHVESKKQSYYGSSSSSGAAEARNRASSRDKALTFGSNDRVEESESRSTKESVVADVEMGWIDEDGWEEDELAVIEEPESVYYKFDDAEISGELAAQVAELQESVFESKTELQLLSGLVLDGADMDPNGAELGGLAVGVVGGVVEGVSGGVTMGSKGYGASGAAADQGRSFNSEVVMADERAPEKDFNGGDDFDGDDGFYAFDSPDEPMYDPVPMPEPEPLAEPVYLEVLEADMDYRTESVSVAKVSGVVINAAPASSSSYGVTAGRGAGAQAPRPGGRATMAPPREDAPPPPPATGKTAPGDFASLDGKPAISATTLAIPLPDHGESVVVVQRLLDPGEAPTLTIRYRETR